MASASRTTYHVQSIDHTLMSFPVDALDLTNPAPVPALDDDDAISNDDGLGVLPLVSVLHEASQPPRVHAGVAVLLLAHISPRGQRAQFSIFSPGDAGVADILTGHPPLHALLSPLQIPLGGSSLMRPHGGPTGRLSLGERRTLEDLLHVDGATVCCPDCLFRGSVFLGVSLSLSFPSHTSLRFSFPRRHVMIGICRR